MSNAGPNSSSTLNNYILTTDNLTYPQSLSAHLSAHIAMGLGSVLPNPASFGFIGDSITAQCSPNGDLFGMTAATGFAAAYAANPLFSLRAWPVHAAMRSNGNWFPFEFIAGKSGATSADILASCVPAMTGYPYGQPNSFCVLAGTNDFAAGLTVSQSVTAIMAIWAALIALGKPVVGATLCPTTSLSDGLSAPNRLIKARWYAQHAIALLRAARSIKIPIADFYSALVGSDGNWYDDAYHASGDYTHLSPLGSTLMGKALNDAISNAFKFYKLGFAPAAFDDSTDTTQARDPLLTLITGTINTASSYPSQWPAPPVTTISKMISSAGTEAGTGVTALPTSNGNTIGNVWELTGDGVNSYGNSGPTIACSTGDKLALSFRIKNRPVSTLTGNGCLSPFVGLLDNNNGHKVAGIASQAEFGGPAATCQIGNEATYPCGLFYFEFTVKADFHLQERLAFRTYADGAPALNDTLDVSNFQVINLTTRGIV